MTEALREFEPNFWWNLLNQPVIQTAGVVVWVSIVAAGITCLASLASLVG